MHILQLVPEPMRSLMKSQSRAFHDFTLKPAGDFFHSWIPQYYESSRPAVPLLELQVGQSHSVTWNVSKLEVIRFACAVGDFNKAHTIGSSLFKNKPVAHGMLVASVWSRIFGTEFPGDGTIYLEQSIKWLKPVYVGETIVGAVTITDINAEKGTIAFATTVHLEDGKLAVTGESISLSS